MPTRLEILKNSLTKKENLFNEKISEHFATVKAANGQPLNGKRNGRATMNKWERQDEALRKLKDGIEKTKEAIENELGKIQGVEHVNKIIPSEILDLVSKGELTQWRKHPNIFFVPGVEKARMGWDMKKGILYHSYVNRITDKEQHSKFAKVFNGLKKLINQNQKT